MLRLLLENGADINYLGELDYTPLREAVKARNEA
jgi:hypothetical protein